MGLANVSVGNSLCVLQTCIENKKTLKETMAPTCSGSYEEGDNKACRPFYPAKHIAQDHEWRISEEHY